MNWLVKTSEKQLEVWSDDEYQHRLRKCEYYGARPFWQKVTRLSPPDPGTEVRYSIGEVIPYKRPSLGRRFAVIVDLFKESGQQKFLGIDIENKNRIISSVS